MDINELSKVLKSYSKLKLANKSLLYKIQQMERELTQAKGIIYGGESVSGGTMQTISERFAVMLDAKEQYAMKCERTEILGAKIEKLIAKLYSENIDLEPTKWEKHQMLEVVLFNYYINEMTIYDLMIYINYSKRQVIRYLKEGKQLLLPYVKDITYKEFMTITEEDRRLSPHVTLKHDIVIL